jgi:5-methylcytosine-specific restriction endonuclease McrBC GTP-binding regulatory subunit McrB
LEAFEHPIGAPGQHYLTGRPYQMAFYLGFARQLKTQSFDPYNADRCKSLTDQVKQQVKDEYGQTPGLGRNMLLHLLFPDEFERIAADDSKKRIADRFAQEASVSSGTDVDDALLVIRRHLTKELDRPNLDFYEKDIEPLWRDGEPLLPNPFAKLIAATLLNEVFLREIKDLLEDKKQLIFKGPPGSGKTYVAEKFARWFTGQSLDAETLLNEQVEIVQFHQSYGYEDFVQGIRPETNDDDQLVYRVRDGIFLTLCERAKANPGKPFVLIIDEINRGNISRIFGELLLLLEYRGMSVRLPYGSGDQATLTIPKNLYIIGTMNTADRSLAQIDYALRRRFYFVRFMPVEDGRAEVFENWLATRDIDPADWSRLLHLFVTLNQGIREHLGTDDLQIGHSYFMTDGIETEVVLDRVWVRAVSPLLNEYLHHHRNRDEILAELTPASLARTTVEVVPENDTVLDEQADGSGPDPV